MKIISNAGFATPESITVDPKNDVYLVSNINGSPTERDDNGFISRLSPDGEVLELEFVSGKRDEVTLNAPKGIVVSEGKLYVADIDHVRVFDSSTGEPLSNVHIEGTSFLNGLTVGEDGTVYVSASGLDAAMQPTHKDAIYRLDGENAHRVASSTELSQPNGLAAVKGGFWVASWNGSKLLRISASGKIEDERALPQGQLDGLVVDRTGRPMVSSWEAATIFREEADGTFTPEVSGVEQPADIGYDEKRNRLLIPLFGSNAVVVHDLSPPLAGE